MTEEDSLYDEVFNQNMKTSLVTDIEYPQENNVKLATLANEKFKSQNIRLKKQVSSLKSVTLDLSKRNTELEENIKDHAMTSSEEIGLKDQEVKVLRAKLIDVLSRLEEEQPWELSTKQEGDLSEVKIEKCNTGNRQFVRKRKAVPDLKPEVPKLLNSTGKTYSDSYGDSCIVVCSICGEHMPIVSMRWHTSSLHHLSITKYKEQCGGQLTFVRIAFHLCKLCGKEIQLDKDSIASHVRGAHRIPASQYNQQFMINTRRVGQARAGVVECVRHHDGKLRNQEEDQEHYENRGSDENDDGHGSHDDMESEEDDGINFGEDSSSSDSETPSENDLYKANGEEIDDPAEDVSGSVVVDSDNSWEWEDDGERSSEDDESWDWEDVSELRQEKGLVEKSFASN